jgi:hypothetical protein
VWVRIPPWAPKFKNKKGLFIVLNYNLISQDTPKAYVNKNTSFSRHDTRNFLLKKSPNCAYCGVDVVWFKNNGGILPDNFATLDHYYSRHTGKYNDDDNFVVICCLKCNKEKNNEEVQS